jgi:hypothetical protein
VQRVGRKGRGRIAVVNLQSEQHVNVVVVRIIRMRKNLFAF